MSVQTEINRINTAVETQADLIGQIKTALQGKGVSGGGNSVLETCTVTIRTRDGASALYYAIGTAVSDNQVQAIDSPASLGPRSEIILSNVLCGSAIHIDWNKSMYGVPATSLQNAERMYTVGNDDFKITNEAGASVVIEMYDND